MAYHILSQINIYTQLVNRYFITFITCALFQLTMRWWRTAKQQPKTSTITENETADALFFITGRHTTAVKSWCWFFYASFHLAFFLFFMHCNCMVHKSQTKSKSLDGQDEVRLWSMCIMYWLLLLFLLCIGMWRVCV